MVEQRGVGATLEYRVKWEGFKSGGCMTWELGAQLAAHAAGFSEALVAFEQRKTRDASSGALRAASASTL